MSMHCFEEQGTSGNSDATYYRQETTQSVANDREETSAPRQDFFFSLIFCPIKIQIIWNTLIEKSSEAVKIAVPSALTSRSSNPSVCP
mmetsp:Transcript_11737/g.29682  ORF Transcript_11737/g.29682 Transcript_11737/m.29682 type:complete len:88 (-) Transcript_11737:932-1195(-)